MFMNSEKPWTWTRKRSNWVLNVPTPQQRVASSILTVYVFVPSNFDLQGHLHL